MNLPVRAFRVENFKAIRDSGQIEFGPLTVFIGNNASGKSSLIEGLETFRDIVVVGLDSAMLRWHGFEHVWNRAVAHEVLRQRSRPHHTNPMAFHLRTYLGPDEFRFSQEINISEGGNQLFIQREEALSHTSKGWQSVTRNDQGHVRWGRNPEGKNDSLWGLISTMECPWRAISFGRTFRIGSSCRLLRNQWGNRFRSSARSGASRLPETAPTSLNT